MDKGDITHYKRINTKIRLLPTILNLQLFIIKKINIFAH